MNYDPTNDMAAPDLSHLTEEERKIIKEVMKRQNAEENGEKRMREQHEKELKEIEKLIEERKTSISKIQATIDPALCQICLKTKFADGVGRKCVHCQLKVCVRCSKCLKLKNKVSWACQLCSKRQELLSKSGIWFQNKRQSPTDHPPPLQKLLPPSSTTTTPPVSCFTAAAATPSVETTPTKKLDRKYSTDWAKSLKEPHQCYENDSRHGTPADVKKKSPDEKDVKASTLTSVVATAKTENVVAVLKGETVAARITDNADDRQVQSGVTATNGFKTDVSKSHEQSQKASSPETTKCLRNGPSPSTSPHFSDSKFADTAGVELEQQKVPFLDNGAPLKDIVGNRRQNSDRMDVGPKSFALPNGPVPQPVKTPPLPPPPTSTENESNNYDKEEENNKIENAESKKQHQQGAPKRALYQKKSLNDCASHQVFLKHEEKRTEKSYCQRVINNSSSSSSSLEDENLYRRPKVDQERKISDPKGRKEQVHRKSDTLSERTDLKSDQISSTVWKMNRQKTKFLGRIFLRRSKNGSLGLKVIGGRRNKDGSLGAYVTKVMPGSSADYVGQLKPGDEVIEWNGRQLKNLSFEAVCEVVKESQSTDCVKIIASRSIKPQTPPHSQTLDTDISLSEERLTPQKRPEISSTGPPSSCSGQIYGKILVSLSYNLAERTLFIAVHQAVDLAPREDGSGRNPFVKIFLLPDRGENSRRQSVTLMNTCLPNWEQNFLYRNVSPEEVAVRVLEITIWDYDQFQNNYFLGEALIDLSYPDVYVNHQWYLMVDMSDDSPLRMMSKSRTALYNQYGLSNRPYSAACDSFSLYESTEKPIENRPRSSCISDLSDQRTYRERKTRSFVGDQGESSFDDVYRHPAWHYAKNRCQQNYPSNNRLSSYDMLPVQVFHNSADYCNLLHYNHNNDGSLTATTTLAARPSITSSSLYLADQTEILENRAKSNRIAEVDYGSVFSCASNKENDKIVRKASSGATRRSLKRHQSLHDRNREMDQPSSAIEPNYGDVTLQVRVDGANDEMSNDYRRTLSPDVNSSRIENATGGYQSDESEISGANFTPKKPSRAPKLRHFRSETGQSQTLTSVDDRSETETSNAETTIDLTLPGDDTVPVKMQQKKKLMNRLVPNKIAGRHLFEQKKMTSFSRSEEVRTPSQLQAQASLIQQLSVDSTGSISSDSTAIPLNVATDPSLAAFLSTLGPGQVVGRQVLASPCLGEIQLILFVRNNKLEIKILKCRNLVKKAGAKYNPAPFVKLYLMDGKRCVAKAKSATAARIAEPHFDQHLIFEESHKRRYLQLSLWGDYGRMERKCFMGIALLKLDDIDFTGAVEGWYKLYHTNSLIGLSNRVDSDASTIRGSQEIDKII